jgi:hypothetical protein
MQDRHVRPRSGRGPDFASPRAAAGVCPFDRHEPSRNSTELRPFARLKSRMSFARGLNRFSPRLSAASIVPKTTVFKGLLDDCGSVADGPFPASNAQARHILIRPTDVTPTTAIWMARCGVAHFASDSLPMHDCAACLRASRGKPFVATGVKSGRAGAARPPLPCSR